MENIKIILVHVLKLQWIAALNKINEDIERNQRSIRNSKIQLEMLKEEDNDPFDVKDTLPEGWEDRTEKINKDIIITNRIRLFLNGIKKYFVLSVYIFVVFGGVSIFVKNSIESVLYIKALKGPAVVNCNPTD